LGSTVYLLCEILSQHLFGKKRSLEH